MTDFFTPQVSQSYDEKNSRLSAISDNMHFLIRLIVNDLPKRARILCVGVGTGAEILSLAHAYPEWSFVGVDPSSGMLDVCRQRLAQQGVLERCELIHGYSTDLPEGENFDATLSILVAHFVKADERVAFYTAMQQRLKHGGYFINTELSFDLNSPAHDLMLENWAKVQMLMGMNAEALQALPQALRDVLCVLPHAQVEEFMKASGIAISVRFFQSFMITGWFSKKE